MKKILLRKLILPPLCIMPYHTTFLLNIFLKWHAPRCFIPYLAESGCLKTVLPTMLCGASNNSAAAFSLEKNAEFTEFKGVRRVLVIELRNVHSISFRTSNMYISLCIFRAVNKIEPTGFFLGVLQQLHYHCALL